MPSTTFEKCQETLNIWIKTFLLWSGNIMLWVLNSLRSNGGRERVRTQTLPQSAHRLRQEEHEWTRQRANETLGAASSSAVLERPGQSLNLHPITNCKVSWWSQSTNNPLQVWQNLRGSPGENLVRLKCSTSLVESSCLKESEKNTDCIVFQLNFLNLCSWFREWC